MNQKLAADVPGILNQASAALRKFASKNVELVQERDAALHELEARKLASRMTERGIDPGTTYEEKVAQLTLEPASKLASLKQAVELAAGGVSFGKIDNTDTKSAGTQEMDPVEAFVLSQV